MRYNLNCFGMGTAQRSNRHLVLKWCRLKTPQTFHHKNRPYPTRIPSKYKFPKENFEDMKLGIDTVPMVIFLLIDQ
jgi:hypothetical protein